MKALLYERNLLKFAYSNVASSVLGSGRALRHGPLQLTEIDFPTPINSQWEVLEVIYCGICGSDLATIDGKSSRYFEELVSFPFVPGHEIVARRQSSPTDRFVIEPVLSCRVRSIDELCDNCKRGDNGSCLNITSGVIAPGIQTGYCADTCGGFGEYVRAHQSQLYRIPNTIDDKSSIMIEPTACAIHAVLQAGIIRADAVAIIGAGTLGLTCLSALRNLVDPRIIIASAKYDTQKQLCRKLGADIVTAPDGLLRAVRRATNSSAIGSTKDPLLTAQHKSTLSKTLTLASSYATDNSSYMANSRNLRLPVGPPRSLVGGCDVVIDCVGTEQSLTNSLSIVRPRGTIVLVGMPSNVTIDLAPLWQREVRLIGSYAYGSEDRSKILNPSFQVPKVSNRLLPELNSQGELRTFDLAIELVRRCSLGELVSCIYPIERYSQAFEHCAQAGIRGSVKIALSPLKQVKERGLSSDKAVGSKQVKERGSASGSAVSSKVSKVR